MQPHPLTHALGGLTRIPQFFVWHLTWSPEEGKFLKVPRRSVTDLWPMDAKQPHNWMTYDAALASLAHMRAADAGGYYTLGFYMTPGCGYWFLDIDKCIKDGVYSDLANDWVARLPGCMVEISSSQNGVHVFGRGELPPHGKRGKKTTRYEHTELYTESRGIAFGLSGTAWGSADTQCDGILSIAAEAFPAPLPGEEGTWLVPRADWNGPTDDAVLLERMLASQSMAARFGSRATFADLWHNRTEVLDAFYGADGRTERDAAMAAHLAFWTGCDAPRMERLMWQSGLVRDKWYQHKTYLRELTIEGACAKQGEVLKESPRVDVSAMMYGMPELPSLPALPGLPDAIAPPVVVTPEMSARVNELLDMVTGSTDFDDMHNRVIPTISAARIPPALMPRLENAVNKRLDLWDGKLPVAKLRALLSPPYDHAGAKDVPVGERPEWANKYVYVLALDKFHNTATGIGLSRTSFNATHDRDMPIKGDGPMREDSVQWALHRWDVPLVQDTMYYPGKPSVLMFNDLQWANLYTESSHPVTAAQYTTRGAAAIERFKAHLWAQCGGRERVYQNLLSFMAHNVQHPGRKIRWVPIIKGTEGDGKTLISAVMGAAMGARNVASIGPEIVANSGGFTDWAHGEAFVALEELYMAGRERHKISNSLKQFISNNDATINVKGGKPKKVVNTCNFAAFTNHNDAVPIDSKKDRRWFVVFTPFDTLDQMNASLGLKSDKEAEVYFDLIFNSLRGDPKAPGDMGDAGEWRKWLLEMEIPDWFSANGRAMATEEKQIMAMSGADDVESIAAGVIEEGRLGVSKSILSSAMLSSAMKQVAFMDSVEIPKGQSMHHMLNRMGFVKVPAYLKWEGSSHRVWVRPGADTTPDALRAALSATRSVSTVTSP